MESVYRSGAGAVAHLSRQRDFTPLTSSELDSATGPQESMITKPVSAPKSASPKSSSADFISQPNSDTKTPPPAEVVKKSSTSGTLSSGAAETPPSLGKDVDEGAMKTTAPESKSGDLQAPTKVNHSFSAFNSVSRRLTISPWHRPQI
jgi:hypothetical protein